MKKRIGLIITIFLSIVITLGVTFAMFTYTKTGTNNHVVAGDIYMHYNNGPTKNISMIPNDTYNEGDYFEFTIDGKNTSDKTIKYEIVLNHGANLSSPSIRLNDKYLRFRLVTVNNDVETEVISKTGYETLNNTTIYTDTIETTNKEIETKYRLYTWVEGVIVGNVDGATYSSSDWEKIYTNIAVSVNGDFEDKTTAESKIVTFNPNGGTVNPTSKVYSTTTFGELPEPIKNGYMFDGWYLEDTLENKVSSSTTLGNSKNITLYAKWVELEYYTITLNNNGATNNPTSSITATYKSSVINPSEIKLAKKEYQVYGFTTSESRKSNDATISSTDKLTSTATLNGYYTEETGGTKVLNANTRASFAPSVTNYTDAKSNWIKQENTTLYAQYSSISEVTLPTITKTGYTCGFTESENGTTITYQSKGSLTPSSDKELYSVCVAETYEITIKAGNGINSLTQNGWTGSGTGTITKKLEYGSTLDLSTITLNYKNGYSGANYTKTTGEGTISNNIYTVGEGEGTITINATTIETPNPTVQIASTSKIYGLSTTALSGTVSNTYDSKITVNYTYYYDTNQNGTYANTQTSPISATSHKGVRYYKVKATATDGTLTSSVGTSSNNVSLTLIRTSYTPDANNCGTLTTQSAVYAYKGENKLYNATTGGSETTWTNMTVNPGYTLDGWYTESNGGSKVLNDDGTLSGTAVSSYTTASNYDSIQNRTLYARCSANTYTINYYQGNGTSTAGTKLKSTSTCTYGQSCTLKTYANVGATFPESSHKWTFGGWATTETGTTIAYTDGGQFTYNQASDLNLYAVGQRVFTFSSGIAPTTHSEPQYQYWNPYQINNNYVTSIYVPNATAITGWTFLGYRANNTASSQITLGASYQGTNYKVGANSWTSFDFRAIYKRTISLVYDANGGTGTTASTTNTEYYNSGYGNGSSNSGANVAVPTAFKLATNKFTRTGYTFSKWAVTNDSSTGYTEGETYNNFKPAVTDTTTTKTMYAIWTPNTYTVTLNNQSATTDGSTSVTATYNSAMPTLTKPARSYTITYNYNGNGTSNTTDTATYTFGGYYTETNGGGTQYYTAAGASARTWNIAEDKTLYAKWTSASVTLPTPTRDGYTFNGWYTEASGGTLIGAGGASYTPTETKTIFAHWTINSYTITIKAGNGISALTLANWTNSGTSTISKSLTYGSTLDLSTITATFKGGYSGASYTKTSGAGSISSNTFTVGEGVTTITINATTLASPEPVIITINTTKIYGTTDTTLTANYISIAENNYDSAVTVYYNFGNSTSSNGTYTYGTASKTNTLTVSKTSHLGTKYYKVKAYATDGTLTSSEATSDSMSVTLQHASVTLNTNNCGTIASGTNPYYPGYGTANKYTTATGTTSATNVTFNVKTGFNMNGWYTASSNGSKVLNNDGSLTGTAVANYTTASTYVMTENKTLYAQCTAIPVEATSFTVDNENIRLNDTVETHYTYTGAVASVSYSSNNTSVATVSDTGVITGISAGEATITITLNNYADPPQSSTKSIEITVIPLTAATVGHTKPNGSTCNDGDGNCNVQLMIEEINGMIPNTPSVSTFTFTINGTTYTAEEGMTWNDWINSSYNTIGVTSGPPKYNGSYISDTKSRCVKNNDTITNLAYQTASICK